MKTRQYKKLCKKAMEILVTGGMNQEDFYQGEDCLTYKGKTHWLKCWGLETGPDYFGECDWFDAWYILTERVAINTADFESCTGSDEDDPWRTSVTGTINILRHGRLMYGLA
jgi:hypothetical protein